MSTKSFQVLFTGRLCEGRARRESISLLAERFQLDFEQIKHLLARGNAIVKRCAERGEAEKLVQAFAQAGWIASIRELPRNPDILASKRAVALNTTPRRKVHSVDGSSVLMTPQHWEEMQGLNRDAIIQAGCLNENEFCVVLSQKVSLTDTEESVKNYCSAQLLQCVQQVEKGVLITPATRLARRKDTAFFGEISAEIDSVPVGYLVACLGDGDRMITVFLWCEKREYKKKKSLLMDVVSSFELSADSGATRQRAAKVVPLY